MFTFGCHSYPIKHCINLLLIMSKLRSPPKTADLRIPIFHQEHIKIEIVYIAIHRAAKAPQTQKYILSSAKHLSYYYTVKT